MSAGSTTAALVYGGSPTTANSETYDGTCWTEGNNLARNTMYASGTGSATAALCMGGEAPGLVANVMDYDGTSWTEVGDLPSAISSSTSGGTPSAAITAGGWAPGYSDKTMQYDGTSWTEVNTMGTARAYGGSSGLASTNMMYISGYTGSYETAVEEWDQTALAVKTVTVS